MILIAMGQLAINQKVAYLGILIVPHIIEVALI